MLSGAYRLPTEPYPGLRPFLDHESALLQGRAGQVKAVIERLQQTHFVAVVGGSGSGKSSLIRAGVVPRLRAVGIPEAGGYWVPVVCTPGTTAAPAVPAVDGALALPRGQTPLTRLAWKFSQALMPLHDPAEAQLRREQIAAMFVRGAGFARLVDAFSEELPESGPDRSEARFLFVIDQFEELFHPNNHGDADARALVEAVIAHFYNPHPRCYVVTTMRSEHLADCAGYLDLPDAINRSMYLVRRLNEIELRDAIVGPALVYLRLCQRATREPGHAPLPTAVLFDEPLIQRLLDDVNDIVDDPDHLPLLQHVLGRLWESACRREGVPAGGVPGTVIWADLERAALPPGLEQPRIDPAHGLREHPEINVLRVSLDHWAQLRYEQRGPGQRRPAAERRQFDAVLRRLAYRDPNNGLYFQQRAEIDDPALMPEEEQPRARLRAMLEPGFLDEVNYLFWDRENPRCETLKVSHEAFIRGWDHFRKLIDEEADRFEEFLVLLRRCAGWQQRRDERLLLESADLLRVEQARLDQVLLDPRERADWFRVLGQCRDGKRLAGVAPVIDEFLRASRAKEAAWAHEQADSLKRRRRYLMGGLAAVGVALAAAAATLVQTPVIRSIEGFADARFMTERLPPSTEEGSSVRTLAALLVAAQKVAQAKDEVRWLFPWSRQVDWLPLIGPAGRLPALVSSEPSVNGNLRQVLTSAVWRSAMDAAAVAALPAQYRFEPMVHNAVSCLVGRPDGLNATSFTGLVAQAAGPERADGRRRTLLISHDPVSANITFHVVQQFDSAGCRAAPAFWAVPGSLGPRIILDARLRYVGLLTERNDFYNSRKQAGQPEPDRRDAETSSFTLYQLRWAVDAADEAVGAEVRPRFATTGRVAARAFDLAFRREAEGVSQHVRVVPSWRESGGYGLLVGGLRWRVVDATAAELVHPGAPEAWVALQPAATGSACQSLQQRLQEPRFRQPGFASQVFQLRDGCIEIKRGDPPGQHLAEGRREQVMVGLYDRLAQADLARRDDALPSTVASLTAFERRRVPEAGATEQWMLGTQGPYEGWIALRRGDGAAARWWGAPLTTRSLMSMGQALCALSKPAAAVTPAAQPCAAP